MTIALPPEIESRLMRCASRLGLDAAEYAGQLIARHLGESEPTQSLAELFAEWDQEDASDDPAELARRRREFEELKQTMNSNRQEMEGPLSRKPWP